MTIRIYNDKIRFTDGTNSVDLLVESDGLRFTGSLTVNANSTFVRPIAIPPPSVGGEGQKIYAVGSYQGTGTYLRDIQYWPGAISSGTATDIGDLGPNGVASNCPSNSSPTHGFNTTSGTYPGFFGPLTRITSFPFVTSGASGTNVGSLPTYNHTSGSSSNTTETAFIVGGSGPPGTAVTETSKFTFSNASSATITASLPLARKDAGQQMQNLTTSIAIGGPPAPSIPPYVHRDGVKFTFANETFAVQPIPYFPTSPYSPNDYKSTYGHAGFSSLSNNKAYKSGGDIMTGAPFGTSSTTTISGIQAYSFASDTLALVGDTSLNPGAQHANASPTPEYGFISGGQRSSPTGTYQTNIVKFPFASEGNATDIADLATGTSRHSSHQD